MIESNLLNDFLNHFPIPKGNKEKPYIILFDAFTGMGKSTVAKIISKYDNSIILNNDEVRNFLNDYDDKSNLKDNLQKYRLQKLLENNNSCIQDSCFCHNYKDKIKYYDSLGYKYYIIRIDCSEDIVKSRLQERTINEDNFSKGDFNDYLWMKNNVKRVPLDLVSYTINTEEDVEKQVLEFLQKYNLLSNEKKMK